MVINLDSPEALDLSVLNNIDLNKNSLVFTSKTFTHYAKDNFQKILEVFLNRCNQSYLYNCLSYCILELMDNASKANAKRIFFKEKNLNIQNQTDYSKGMESFRDEVTKESKHYLDEAESADLHIDLSFIAGSEILIRVSNNTGLTDFEYSRIQNKIEQSKKYETMADALMDIDHTEGSGLGIISIILMLRRFGLSADHLSFERKENQTDVTITIPVDSLEEI